MADPLPPSDPPPSTTLALGRWLLLVAVTFAALAVTFVYLARSLVVGSPVESATMESSASYGSFDSTYPAPKFRLASLDGGQLGPPDFSGKVVVLDFWATWCGPCKLEIPSLQSLHEDRAADGVAVLGLSTDRGDPADVAAYLNERSVRFPVGIATTTVRRAFGEIHGIPTTFIIDREGTIRHRVVGYFTPPALRAAVGRLIDEDREEIADGSGAATGR